MAVGDDAIRYGYPIVPNTGEEGRVRYGAREINRTRDYVAQVRGMIPNSKTVYRQTLGISYGTAMPSGGETGDIYFRIVG